MSEPETTAESTPTSAPPKKSWLKTIWGTVAGLVSAAVMAWVSPLVTNVAKPSKPVANFATQHKGLDVTFKNESLGASKCRWDFGDGSPLEFVASSQTVVEHTYEKADVYDVKLVVSNILGEENERAIKLDLRTSPDTASGPKPSIVDLYAKAPHGPNGGPVYAPATYQFGAIVEDAKEIAWKFEDGDVQQGANASHVFPQPGNYRVKLCVYNGGQTVEKEIPVSVAAPPAGALTVRLVVTDQGTPVDVKRLPRTVSHAATINGAKGPTTLEAIYTATKGFQITSYEPKENKSTPNVIKVDYQLAPDRTFLKAIARLKPSDAPADAILNQVVMIEETRKGKPSVQTHTPVTGAVIVPGTTVLATPPAPDNFVGLTRQMTLEVWQRSALVWRGASLPHGTPITVNGYAYTLNTTQNGDKIELQIGSPGAAEPRRSTFDR